MQNLQSRLLYLQCFVVTKTAFNLFRVYSLLLSEFDSFSPLNLKTFFYSVRISCRFNITIISVRNIQNKIWYTEIKKALLLFAYWLNRFKICIKTCWKQKSSAALTDEWSCGRELLSELRCGAAPSWVTAARHQPAKCLWVIAYCTCMLSRFRNKQPLVTASCLQSSETIDKRCVHAPTWRASERATEGFVHSRQNQAQLFYCGFFCSIPFTGY